MQNFTKLKAWMDEVYDSSSFNRELLDKFFKLNDDDYSLVDLNELIHQLDASGEWSLLKKTPEFLMNYYIIKEKGESDKNELKEIREKLYKFISKDKVFDGYFDSYEEFRRVLEEELKNELH